MYVILITQPNFRSIWRSLHEVKADTEREAPHALTPMWDPKEPVTWNCTALPRQRFPEALTEQDRWI